MNFLKIPGLLILGLVVLAGIVTALSFEGGSDLNTGGTPALLKIDRNITPAPPQGNTSDPVGSSADASSNELFDVVKAPINPDFRDYLEQREVTLGYSRPNELFVTGYVPSPVDFSHTAGMLIRPQEQFTPPQYPPAFDLRDQGKVSAVKHQGDAGSCWAFATYGSLESFILPDEEWDFSENNLKNLLKPIYADGFDFRDSGNHLMSTAYLARGSGPIREQDDPYIDKSINSPDDIPPVKHVQNVHFIPERTSVLDNDNIKWALTNYGAVQIAMYIDAWSYNETSSACYQDQVCIANHAVTVVGWDDAYDRSNFLMQPPQDGAFIIKNSWGTDWGDDGYFYLSYYDPSIQCMVVFTAEDTTLYNHIYQYDPLGLVNHCGYNYSDHPDSAGFANVFTAVEDETLTAVSFYTAVPDAEYVIDIYTNPEDGPIGNGESISSASGTLATPGYHTVKMPTAEICKGQRFSVVVKLRTPGYDFPIPFEYPYEGYSSKATANAGESYISRNGKIWADIVDYKPNSNVCLKAFTSRTSENLSLSVLPASSTLVVGQTRPYTFVLDRAPQGLSTYNISVQLTNPAVAEIVGVQFPPWSSLAEKSTLPADLAWFTATDATGASGTANIMLATVTVRADAIGATDLAIVSERVEDPEGGRYTPDVLQAHLQVGASALQIPGRILAADYDTGGEGVAYHDTTPGNIDLNPSSYRSDDVDIGIRDWDKDPLITNTAAGEWLRYTVNVEEAGTYEVEYLVYTKQDGCTLSLAVDGDSTGTVSVPAAASWETPIGVKGEVAFSTAGEHQLILRLAGDLNLNGMTFSKKEHFEPSLVIPGRILAADYDTGGEGVAYHDTTPGNIDSNPSSYRSDDVDIGIRDWNADPLITNTAAGEWLRYTVNVEEAGTYEVEYLVYTTRDGCTLDLAVDGNSAGKVSVPKAASWRTPIGVKGEVEFSTAGEHKLILRLAGDLNLNGMTFSKKEQYVQPSLQIPGRILAADYDTGGEGVAYHDTTPGNIDSNPSSYRSDDVDIGIRDWDPAPLITNTAAGEWLRYTVNVEEAGTYEAEYVVYTKQDGCTLSLAVDGDSTGTVSIPAAASWETPIGVKGEVEFSTAGEHQLILRLAGDLNLNGMTFSKKEQYVQPYLQIPGLILAADYDEGGEGVVYHDTTPGNIDANPSPYRSDDVDIGIRDWAADPLITNTAEGEWLRYTVDVEEAGTYEVEYLVYTKQDGCTLSLAVDGDSTGTVSIPAAASWETPIGVKGEVEFSTAGEHQLILRLAGDLNLNGMTFSKKEQYVQPSLQIPGRILAADYDTGGEGFAYHDTTPGNIASNPSSYRSDDVDTGIRDWDKDPLITNTEKGEWLRYTVNVEEAGTYGVEYLVYTKQDGCTLSLAVDGDPTGTFSVPAAASWETPIRVKGEVEFSTAGEHQLILRLAGDLNLNGMTFSKKEDVEPSLVIPGRILAADYDTGGEGVAYHDTTPGNIDSNPSSYRNDDVDIGIRDWDSDPLITNTAAGEWLRYTVDVAEAGTYEIEYLLYTTQDGCTLALDVDGTSTGTIPVPAAASWKTPIEVKGEVTFSTAGTHQLIIRLAGDMNLNRLTFTRNG